jgi:hypothetical protein
MNGLLTGKQRAALQKWFRPAGLLLSSGEASQLPSGPIAVKSPRPSIL